MVGSCCRAHRMVMTLHNTTLKSRCCREVGAAEAPLHCDRIGKLARVAHGTEVCSHALVRHFHARASWWSERTCLASPDRGLLRGRNPNTRGPMPCRFAPVAPAVRFLCYSNVETQYFAR